MPPVLAAVFLAAAPEIFGATIIGGVTVASVAGSLAFTGLLLGAQMLFAGGGKKSTKSEQVTSRDSNPQRLRGYGRAKLGGSTFFLHSVNGAFLVRGWVHCEGPIDAYEVWYLNDTACTIPEGALGGAAGVAPWIGAVIMESHLGAPDQAASGMIASYSPDWTSDHRLAGLAYTVQTCVLPPKPDKTFQTVFPDGPPTPRVVARLSKVYDPRTNDTAWHQNPSLCIMDYLTLERVDQVTGQSWRYIPASRIDIQSFIDFAEVCDAPIPLAAGGVEARYHLDGVYDLSEEPRDVLKRMLATCDGEIVQTAEGKVGIRGGIWIEPTVTITEADILSVTYTQGNDKLSAFNRLKWTFTDQANDFQQVEGDPWDDVDSQVDTGEVLTQSVDFTMVMSHPQGRRLAKIMTAKQNPRHHLTDCVAKLPALNLLGERVVRVQLASLGIDEVFTINSFKPADDLSSVTLDLSSTASDAYDWNPSLEEGTPPPSPISLPSSVAAPEPQNVTLSLVRQTVSAGVFAVQIHASATTNTSDNLSAYWSLIGQTRVSPDGAWVDMVPDGGPDGALSNILSDGVTYDVQVAYVGLGMQSAWSTPQSILATSDITPPAPPVGLVANASISAVMLAWTAPGSANTHACQLWRSSGSSSLFSSAAKVGPAIVMSANQAFDKTDGPPLAAGDYRYWVTALNGSGIASDPAGPANVTVT